MQPAGLALHLRLLAMVQMGCLVASGDAAAPDEPAVSAEHREEGSAEHRAQGLSISEIAAMKANKVADVDSAAVRRALYLTVVSATATFALMASGKVVVACARSAAESWRIWRIATRASRLPQNEGDDAIPTASPYRAFVIIFCRSLASALACLLLCVPQHRGACGVGRVELQAELAAVPPLGYRPASAR